jgi:hypothetical protein
MPLKDVTVSSILDGGKNQKLWKKIRDKFVSKIQKQHKLSDDKVEKLEKMLMDKKVLKQGIADFKEIHKDTQIGGAKKKSRRRKKKKYAKKTKRRYRRGGNGLETSFLIYLGIMGVTCSIAAVWLVAEWGCNRLVSACSNCGEEKEEVGESEAKNDVDYVDDDERLRRGIQSSMTDDDSEPVTERSASDAYDDVYGNLPLRRRR